MAIKSVSRNKIQAKNKNVINIKINTEKKQKKKTFAKRSGPPKSRINSSSGYSMMPPIIIQPQAPTVFPNYNPPAFINNNNNVPNQADPIRAEPVRVGPIRTDNFTQYERIRNYPIATQTEPEPIAMRAEPIATQTEPFAINTEPIATQTEDIPVYIKTEPVRIKTEPVHIKSEPTTPFIKPTSTYEMPLSQTIKVEKTDKKKLTDSNTEFINTPSTKKVSFVDKMTYDTMDDWHTPVDLIEKFKPSPSPPRTRTPTPQLDRISGYYSDNEEYNDVINPAYKEPLSSVKNMKSNPMDDNDFIIDKSSELKRKEHSDNMNARYHSRADDFNRNNPDDKRLYEEVLDEFMGLFPDDIEFANTKPSKGRYVKMLSTMNRQYKKQEKQKQKNEEDDVIQLPRRKSMKKIPIYGL